MNVQTVARGVVLLLLTLVLGLAACGDGGTETPTHPGDPDDPVDPGDPNDPGDPGDPNGTLECEIVGYPCSWATVPLEVIEGTLDRSDEVLARLDAGETVADVAAWLDGQDDVAEVQNDDFALRFRLEGGRGLWISDATWLPPPDAGPAPRVGTYAPATGAPVDIEPARVVVGGETKSALVLSPLMYEFKQFDAGPPIRDVLEGTRGYEGRIEFVPGTDEDEPLSLDYFRSWGDYEVVHVNTHGYRLCKDGVCKGGLELGKVEPYLPEGPGTEAEKIKTLEAEGVEIRRGRTTGTPYLRLAADFFRKAYPSGLDDTIVFLNACMSQGSQGVDVDIADALRMGGRAVVLGWSDTVFSDDAIAAASQFFEDLGKRGYTTRAAVERLGDLRTGKATGHGDNTPPYLNRAGPEGETDLRMREVVTILNPYSGGELAAGDAVGAVGIAGDGEVDAAPFRVLVEGVEEDDAAAVVVHVSVDGVAAEPIPLDEGTKNDDDAWVLHGNVVLPYDLTEDRQVVWEATATLHDEGESEHRRSATLSAAEPLLGTTWEMTARHTTHWMGQSTPYGATATILLTFEPGQDPMDPEPDYVITGGTISWDYSHASDTCTRSAPAVTFDMEEGRIFSRRITFDATQTPVTVTGWLRTQTPWVTVSVVCDYYTGTREHRDTHNWFEVGSGDPPQAVQEGELIRGTRCYVQHHSNSTTFVTRSDYVIRRLRPGDESPPPPLHQGSCV